MRTAALAPLLLAASLFAQTQHETTTVEVVQVPVYVSASGVAMTGLAKDDFELYVNGKRQTIDYFDVIDFATVAKSDEAAAAAAGPAAPPDVRQRRLYVLLFDLVYSFPKSVARAQVAADRYIADAGERDLFAVATYTSNHGIQLMVPFTRDREAVHHAVQRFTEASTSDPLRLALSGPDRADVVTPERFAESPDVQAQIGQSAIKELLIDPQRRLIRDEVEALSALADRLAPIEGHRHVVLLTGGFDTTLLHGGGPANTITFPTNFGPNGQMNRGPRQGTSLGMSDPATTHALKEMYSRFTRAGVFLDAIDIDGNRFSLSSSHESEGLSTLARDTGGQVILNRNNLGEAMERLSNMQRVVYVLGFHAHDTGRKENGISVKVHNLPRGAELSYRPSYSTTLPKASSTDGLRLADILENNIPQTGVTLSMASTRKTVDVTIPARDLLALAGGHAVEAEALMYVYSGSSVVAFHEKRITIDPKADIQQPLHVTQSFDLPPGSYLAKVLLRMEGNDALGFARAPMVIE